MPYKDKQKEKEHLACYREEHKDEIRENQKIYYQEHREECLAYHKNYYQINCQKKKDYAKEYRENNREKCDLVQKEYRKNHKEEIKIKKREYAKTHQDVIKTYLLKNNFGITLEQYNNMVISQGGVCAICGKAETSYDKKAQAIKKLAVDHDHVTGKVRGLLCTNCNLMLGSAYDNIDTLKSAIIYLQTTGGENASS